MTLTQVVERPSSTTSVYSLPKHRRGVSLFGGQRRRWSGARLCRARRAFERYACCRCSNYADFGIQFSAGYTINMFEFDFRHGQRRIECEIRERVTAECLAAPHKRGRSAFKRRSKAPYIGEPVLSAFRQIARISKSPAATSVIREGHPPRDAASFFGG